MKRCPFCAEEIQDAAVKCRHCGERLPAEDTLDSAHTIPAGNLQAGVPRPDLPGRAPSPADTLDSARTVWADYVRPGKVLAGQYRIIGDGPLGRGGMGEVWKAEDSELNNTRVAIKVLPEAIARDPGAVENLRREALIGCQLTHANICRLFGLRSDGALKFIVMEYVEGKTLAEVLAARPDHRMAWEDLQPVARQVAAALDYAHAASYTDAAGRKVRGVLHRDLKPANIMVTADGAAKLMDFGIAREIHSTMTRLTGRRSLTPLYASPEQFRGEAMSAASDVYSFASVLYECLAGLPLVSPDGDVEYQVLRKPIEPLPGQAEAVNRGLALALSKDPAERPKSADWLVNILAGLITGPGDVISVARPKKTMAAPGQREEITLDLGGGVTMKCILVPAGKFMMGSAKSETDRHSDEGPQHEVTITKPFYMAATEVTQEQYQRIMGTNPSHFKGAKNPVECVSWDDAAEFCRRLSERTGKTVRLPTEAEWEYACRAGSTTRYCFGDADEGLGEYAWHSANSGTTTHPVGHKKSNAWGLYDMHGNVWEWCADWYGDYPKGAVTDPQGPASGAFRVLRGGSWDGSLDGCRSASRFDTAPGYRFYFYGFRVVVSVSAPGL